ncbi:MAG: TetR family transcriptional regulator [Galbitalea sp.]
MTRDPAAKKRQLLDAAFAEFATHGIAGARVDQIARAAGVSAGLVYTYFGSKDELFEAVFDTVVDRTLSTTPITTDDLPEYAARLFDRYEKAPEVQRLASWYRLEKAGSEHLHAASVKSMRDKVAAIRAAQDAGVLSSRFGAVDLLGLILSISAMWATNTPEFLELARSHSRADRRAVVKTAVAALLGQV